jgi:transcriptional regulator with XRE-family HTH domain
MGPTTSAQVQRLAGNVLRLGRVRRGWSQRELAAAAGVAPSTVGRIESGAVQPSLPTLAKLLAAADAELRVQVVDYDAHDDLLDAEQGRLEPAELAARTAVLDAFIEALRGTARAPTAAGG